MKVISHLFSSHCCCFDRFSRSLYHPFKKSGKFCIHWNRGFCRFSDTRCSYLHKEIPPCRFNMQCLRPDCKYYHDKTSGKYPFLGASPQRFLQSVPGNMFRQQQQRFQHNMAGQHQHFPNHNNHHNNQYNQQYNEPQKWWMEY